MRDVVEKVDRQRLALARLVAVVKSLTSSEEVLVELDAIARLLGNRKDPS